MTEFQQYIKFRQMRRVLLYITFVAIVLTISTACAIRTVAEEIAITAEQAAIIDALERGEFRFISHTTPLHYVCVSPHIVLVTSSPLGFRGCPFTLAFADFEYNVRPGRRAGTWFIQISSMHPLNFTLTTLSFQVRADGTATARSYAGTDRMPIFTESRGRIEIVENGMLVVNETDSIDD